MKCKNCGTEVPKNSSICTTCGAVVDKKSGYVMLTSEYNSNGRVEAINPKKKINTFFAVFISCVLIVAAGIGSYFVFIDQNASKPQPELAFTAGSGVINGDEQVIYVTIKDSSKIEYIHGVKLYDSAIDGKSLDGNVVSSDYQYTKNIDNSFRAIFFDMKDLNLDEGSNYTYTFQMSFSFLGDENIYNYYQTLNFVGSTNTNAAEIVFDHTKKDTTQINMQSTTTTILSEDSKKQAYSYLYEGYWYTEPYKTTDSYSISSICFKIDGTYSSTHYMKKANQAEWNVTFSEGEMQIEGDKIHLTEKGGVGEIEFVVDTNEKTVAEINAETGEQKKPLSFRKYNTQKNAEDFFGL